METVSLESKRSALSRILQSVSEKSAIVLTYTLALLGMANLIPGVQLPPELGLIASGLGVEAMGSLINEVASSKRITDEQIRKKAYEIIGGIDVENLLLKDEFWSAYSRLRKGQHSIGEQNKEIINSLRLLEKSVQENRNSESVANTSLLKSQELIAVLRLGVAFSDFWEVAESIYGFHENSITSDGVKHFDLTRVRLEKLVNLLEFKVFIPATSEEFNLIYDAKSLDFYEIDTAPKEAMQNWYKVANSRMSDYAERLGRRHVNLYHLGYALSNAINPMIHRVSSLENIRKPILSYVSKAELDETIYERTNQYLEDVRNLILSELGEEKFAMALKRRDKFLQYVESTIEFESG